MKKLGRNEPCHCGSGKKFKKCCESTMLGGRFVATKLAPTSAPQVATAPKLTGLFHSRVSAISTPSESVKPINATNPAASAAPTSSSEPDKNPKE